MIHPSSRRGIARVTLFGAAMAALAGCVRNDTPAALTALTSQRPAQSQPAAATTTVQATSPASAPEGLRELPPAHALSDTVISAKVKASLLTDPVMTGSDVSVNTDGGVVHLAGTVRSQEQAAIASAHAQREDGVMRIDNLLTVNAQ